MTQIIFNNAALCVKFCITLEEVLSRLEREAAKIGLHLNFPKTEMMNFNQDEDKIIVARDGKQIKIVFDFKDAMLITQNTTSKYGKR